MRDKHQIIEEPNEVKVSRSVLKTSGAGDSLAEFNRATQDAQKLLQLNLRSNKGGKEKRVLELDIEKCARPEMVKESVEPTPLSDLHHSPSSKTTLWVGLNT